MTKTLVLKVEVDDATAFDLTTTKENIGKALDRFVSEFDTMPAELEWINRLGSPHEA